VLQKYQIERNGKEKGNDGQQHATQSTDLKIKREIISSSKK